MEWRHEIEKLLCLAGGDPNTFEGEVFYQMVETCLKLIKDRHNTGQLKLMMRALKEMRYAYRIFNAYTGVMRYSIFGSARTPESHPNYHLAKDFAEKMTAQKWMCITGAADGIMKAGHEGAHAEASFGLSIRLAFESGANTYIEGDPKLINFRYFFTRKLMFMSHSEAIVVFPGGVGTQDELFEALTLIQTGKSNIVPIVLMEEPGGTYWEEWRKYVDKNLFGGGYVSLSDLYLFYQTKDVDDAVNHITHFYSRYHSSRYVGDFFVLRMKTPIPMKELPAINLEFKSMLKEGDIIQCDALPEETDHIDLPRLVFHYDRRHPGLLRKLIDHVNSL
jgi:uncharacterized protein (TIGR00730 family)